MFSAFRMGQAASSRRLCDIGRVLYGVTNYPKIGNSLHDENIPITLVFRFPL